MAKEREAIKNCLDNEECLLEEASMLGDELSVGEERHAKGRAPCREPPRAARGSVQGAQPTKTPQRVTTRANLITRCRRGSRRVREMQYVADLPEQRAVALPGALPRDVDVP